jgi:hypothetical protein
MKTITIGDVHGRDRWKSVDPERYDKIIFLGDYFDSFMVSDEAMLQNFTEIVAFKQEYFDKVVLLLGNHETSYLSIKYRSTGYRPNIAGVIEKLLWGYHELFKIAWQYKKYLWTHAGVHQQYFSTRIVPEQLASDQTVADTLQRLYEAEYPPIFEVGEERGGQRGNIGGPLWIHKERLMEDPLQGFHQIVGHTPVRTIVQHQPRLEDADTTITFCDCIERGDEKLYECEIP